MTTTTANSEAFEGIVIDDPDGLFNNTTHVVEILHGGLPFSRAALTSTDATVREEAESWLPVYESDFGTRNFSVGTIWKVES